MPTYATEPENKAGCCTEIYVSFVTPQQYMLWFFIFSLVRPQTEYACAVWDPHLSKDVQALEGMQKFGLRVCLN